MTVSKRIEDDPERKAAQRRQQMRIEPRRQILDAERIEANRNLSRLLIMLGVFCLAFGGVWLIYAGSDMRYGRHFSWGLMIGSAVVGLALVIAGAIKRNRSLHYDRKHSKGSAA